MFSDVIGHEEVVEKLKNALRSGRIANAYIFSGPEGVGKEFVAINFAKALNCLSDQALESPRMRGSEQKESEKSFLSGKFPCDQCISCRKIDDGNHADVMVIRPEGARLKIDQMRALQRQGSYRAMEGKYKVYIIAEAEKMTPEAANSMLKTLEEPQGAMVLILLTTTYSALLPTIQSRCQSLKFSLVPPAILRDGLIKRLGIPESKAKWVVLRSQGSVSKALELAKKDEDDAVDDVSESFLALDLKNEVSLLDIFRKAEDLGKAEDSLDALLSWYRDLLLVKQGCSPDLLIHSDKKDFLEKMAERYSDIQIEKLIRDTLRTQDIIQRNINSTLALEVMMLHSFDALSTRL